MEAEPRKQQPPHPSLPANYVSLAQLQEQHRIKLERQRREEKEQARLRELKEEEEERERLRKLEEEEDEGEREEAQRRQTESGTAHVAYRGRRRRPTRWGRKRDEPRVPTVAPHEVVVLPNDGGAVVGGEEGSGEGGQSGGRGRNGGPRRSGLRNRYAVASKCPNPEPKLAAAAAIGGEGGPLAAERSVEVKPSPGNVEEERKEPPSMGVVVLETKLVERPRNVDPVLSLKGVEGAAKEARKVLHSTARKGYPLDKLSDIAEPDSGVEVGQKLKDLSITKPEGNEVGIVGKEDSVEHWPRRTMVGRRGRYPNFRPDGILCPHPRWRPASSKDNVMWVKKIENS